LRILPYTGSRDYHYYLDGLGVNGKRKRLFSKTEAEAKEELVPYGKRPSEPITSPLGTSPRKFALPVGRTTDCGTRSPSYHLAKHQNAPQLALEMGHSTPRMVFDNYREVVAPAEAERYWVIRPNAVVDNADQLSANS
jgi:hypothetical protein